MSARVTWLLAVLLVGACGGKEPKVAGTSAAPPTEPGSASAEPVTLVVAYGSEKKSWLEEESQAFERSGALTRSGRPIRVETQAMGSGEATQAILSGKLRPHVFSPASGVYVTLLNQAWLSVDGHTKPLAPAGARPLCCRPSSSPCGSPWPRRWAWPTSASPGPTSCA
ncbi:MAG: substrate-binding domain-containing protein [Myxococcota bacterium]